MAAEFNFNYVTTNLINEKQYIGMHKTTNINDGYLGSGRALINAIKKYGKINFIREILEFHPDVSTAYHHEEEWIADLNTLVPNGYNINIKGGTGYLSDKSRAKLIAAMTGQKRSNESRKNMSMAALNRSDEANKKINESRRGLKRSEQSIENYRKASLNMSDERKRKIGIATKNMTDEHRDKLRKAALIQWQNKKNNY